jgi:gluconokinase
MRVVMEEPPRALPDGLWCYRVDRRRALVGGALNEGGGVMAWLRDTFSFRDFEAEEAAIAEAEPDAHGLTLLPFLKGERSPGWDADIRAAIVGVSAATTPRDILQATMESIAYRFGMVAEELQQVAPLARRIVASGGGAAHSHVWLQIIADVLNRPIELAEEPETTSRGVAILALESLGIDTSSIPPPDIVRRFGPDSARHARYRHGIERQRRLYRMLADWGRQTSRSG